MLPLGCENPDRSWLTLFLWLSEPPENLEDWQCDGGHPFPWLHALASLLTPTPREGVQDSTVSLCWV